MLKITIIFISLSFIIFGCGNSKSFTTYYFTESDSLYQFTDEEIQKIYESEPQIEVPIKISFYSPSSELHSLVDSLKNNNLIENVYEIPEALVQGDVYFKRNNPNDFYTLPTTNISQLRKLSAQGKSDILLYCGVSYEDVNEANNWVWTHLLIIPAFFMPSFNLSITATVDIFLIDVRNDYLYSANRFVEKFDKKGLTYFQSDYNSIKIIRNKLIANLLPKIVESINNNLGNPEYKKN